MTARPGTPPDGAAAVPAAPATGAGRCAYDAVIFDMDGVVTDTAGLHAEAWKALFDELLGELGEDPRARPFDPKDDYQRFVDGRSREDGVRTFLAARSVPVPDGSPTDPPTLRTVHGLAARKQLLFTQRLATRGVRAFPSTVALLRRLRAGGVRVGLVTASRNCTAILDAAGVTDLFDARVDGGDAARLGLAGKPDPATFLEAARRLRVEPRRAVVVEDAEAGVQAAARGGFGLVVGVDRTGNRSRLLGAGAQLVVTDPAGVDLGKPVQPTARTWCAGASSAGGPWLVGFDGFDPAQEGTRETLCALGNGYWATRGAAPECVADGVHYPGTYLAGVYNRLHSVVEGRAGEDEQVVNAPNWLSLQFRVAGGGWFSPDTADLLAYRQELDLRQGLLTRIVRFRDQAGRTTRVTSRRLVSQAMPHLAALETTFVAEDWSGELQVHTGIDGSVTNRGVAEYRMLADRHLDPVAATAVDTDTVLLETVTSQSGVRIAMAARTRVHDDDSGVAVDRAVLTRGPEYIGHALTLGLRAGVAVTVEKVVAVATSRDRAISTPALAATARAGRAGCFDDLLAAHQRAWGWLWDRFAVGIRAGERTGLALTLNTFHVLQTLSAAGADVDAGVPARGLHGEAYRGHVFWDELFVYPMLTLRAPALTRALLLYRYRRLGEARAAARAAGFRGAMFPWQSGSDGREETPTELWNHRSGRWMPDNSRRQRHVGLAVAYAAWHYYEATGDVRFLTDHGAELLVEVARFFTSLAVHDPAEDRYDIAGVMGPDEFHDGYPGAPGEGLRNNAYTNVLVAWVLRRAMEAVVLLRRRDCGSLWSRLSLHADELRSWDRVSRRLRVPFHADGVISQFEGYERLAELDWAAYRSRYGDIGRLDLILEAEGDSPNRYRVSKQADVLMLFYLFSADELRDVLGRLGYRLPPEAIPRTVDFYLARTSHGSTLSRLVHSWILARGDRHRSWSLFTQTLDSDLADIQGGTTREGIHLGAMAGAVDLTLRCYTGTEAHGDVLWMNPALPPELGGLEFELVYRDQPITVRVSPRRLWMRLHPCAAAPIRVAVGGRPRTLRAGDVHETALPAAASRATARQATAYQATARRGTAYQAD